jgi:hypothetical protein
VRFKKKNPSSKNCHSLILSLRDLVVAGSLLENVALRLLRNPLHYSNLPGPLTWWNSRVERGRCPSSQLVQRQPLPDFNPTTRGRHQRLQHFQTSIWRTDMERSSLTQFLKWTLDLILGFLMIASVLNSQPPIFMRANQGLDLVFLEDKKGNSILTPDGYRLGMIVDAKSFEDGPRYRDGDSILWKGGVNISGIQPISLNMVIGGDNRHIYCIDETHAMMNEFLLELRNEKLFISEFQSLTYASAKYGFNPKVRFFGRVDQWVFFREKGDPANQIKYFEVGKGNIIHSFMVPNPKSDIKYVLNVCRSRTPGEIMAHIIRRSTALISQFPQYSDYISAPFPEQIENY